MVAQESAIRPTTPWLVKRQRTVVYIRGSLGVSSLPSTVVLILAKKIIDTAEWASSLILHWPSMAAPSSTLLASSFSTVVCSYRQRCMQCLVSPSVRQHSCSCSSILVADNYNRLGPRLLLSGSLPPWVQECIRHYIRFQRSPDLQLCLLHLHHGRSWSVLLILHQRPHWTSMVTPLIHGCMGRWTAHCDILLR